MVKTLDAIITDVWNQVGSNFLNYFKNCVSPVKKFMLQSLCHSVSQITASFYLCTLNNPYFKLHLVSTEG